MTRLVEIVQEPGTEKLSLQRISALLIILNFLIGVNIGTITVDWHWVVLILSVLGIKAGQRIAERV